MRSKPSRVLLSAGALSMAILCLAATSLTGPSHQAGPQDPERRTRPTRLAGLGGCSTMGCHDALTKGEFVHGPVAVQKCDICHLQDDPEIHEFRPIVDTAALCADCHELTERPLIHEPVGKGLCTACHDPHSAGSRALLTSADEKAMCGQCHTQSASDKKFVHGPVAAGACSLCHSPHSSYYPSLLNSKGVDSCLKCHSEIEQTLSSSRYWHRPVSEDCSLCHDAHASDHRFQLKQEGRALCLDCHEAKREEIASATVFHEALTEEDGCRTCHNTHASRFPKLLDRQVMDLCLSCHNDPQPRPDGTIVKAMGRELADSKFLHGPIREGDCSSCHNPHGSKNFNLLREAYPERFYAPFDLKLYNLCFSCHDPRMFVDARTTTLTRFRNGDQNLHFLHVNKDTKGRTCRACHNTHASNLPNHIAETVPFGGWEIPINFESRATGGSCAPGCHKPKAYDWVEAVANPDPDRPREDKR